MRHIYVHLLEVVVSLFAGGYLGYRYGARLQRQGQDAMKKL